MLSLLFAFLLLGAIFTLIYVTLMFISLWRYSPGHNAPLIIMIVFITIFLIILGHGIIKLTSF